MRDADATGRPRRSPAPWGVVGTLVLVLLVEGFLRRGSDRIELAFESEWRVAAAAATDSRTLDSALLCFGDSLAKTGLSPPIFERELGRTTYNLAVASGQPHAAYLFLSRALLAGAKPEAILLDCKWTALRNHYAENAPLVAQVFRPDEFLGVGLSARDPAYVGSTLAYWLLDSAREREEIRAYVRDVVAGKDLRKPDAARIYLWNQTVNRGAVHPEPNPANAGALNPFDRRQNDSYWRPNPVNQAYLDRFLGLAEERGIPVFLVVMPVSPAVRSIQEEFGADEAYATALKRITARRKGVVVIDGRKSEYSADAFVDGTHLNRDGAAILSTELARLIRPFLAGRGRSVDGWVSLPRYRPDLPIAFRPENTSESRTALDAFEGNRLR